MEVRHTFSEPRLAVNCEKLTWNVDVYREGVENPVGTLTINEDTMPPRIRKKKVVWKLPDTNQSLPKFGVEEKKRLLEIFKLQKKDRRKSARRSNGDGGGGGSSSSCNNGGVGGHDETMTRHENIPFEIKTQENKIKQMSINASENGVLSFDDSPEIALLEERNAAIISTRSSQQKPFETLSSISSDPISPSSTCPPPGFSQSNPPATMLPVPRFFCVSDDAHDEQGIAITLAQNFIDYYYSSITKGHYEELCCYYAPGVVKSLSIGGAHAFCKSRLDMELQFQSLRGSLWDVTGAVAQDGCLESIVLHITGNAIPKTTATPSPKSVIFSHSITLIKFPEGYQIRNDAMSLITTGL
jgi:hypothetical protein